MEGKWLQAIAIVAMICGAMFADAYAVQNEFASEGFGDGSEGQEVAKVRVSVRKTKLPD